MALPVAPLGRSPPLTVAGVGRRRDGAAERALRVAVEEPQSHICVVTGTSAVLQVLVLQSVTRHWPSSASCQLLAAVTFSARAPSGSG